MGDALGRVDRRLQRMGASRCPQTRRAVGFALFLLRQQTGGRRDLFSQSGKGGRLRPPLAFVPCGDRLFRLTHDRNDHIVRLQQSLCHSLGVVERNGLYQRVAIRDIVGAVAFLH